MSSTRGYRLVVKEDYSAEARGRELVGDWMTRDVITVGPDTPLDEACKVMIEQQIHRVFVTDGENLTGVVSSFDVVRAVARGARQTSARRR